LLQVNRVDYGILQNAVHSGTKYSVQFLVPLAAAEPLSTLFDLDEVTLLNPVQERRTRENG